MAQKMKEFEEKLDEVAISPKKKTPEEMLQNPNDLLNESQTLDEQQKKLDSTWDVTEGQGPHDASINDNGSNKKSSLAAQRQYVVTAVLHFNDGDNKGNLTVTAASDDDAITAAIKKIKENWPIDARDIEILSVKKR